MKDLKRFFFRWQNILGVLIVGLFIFAAAAAPILAPPDESGDAPPSFYKVIGRSTDRTPNPPDGERILGTLSGQFDVYYSLIWGSRHALRFGLVVALGTCLLGVFVGAVSGYLEDSLMGQLMMRITDGFIAVPTIIGVGIFRQLMILAEMRIAESTAQKFLLALGADYVMLGLIFFSWTPYARIINANVAKLRNVDYILAAKTIGVSGPKIILRHLLPNAISPAIVLFARDIGSMVLLGAAFVFIGVGGESPWGFLVTLGRDYVIGAFGNPFQMWWTWLPVTIVLILFGVGWNLLGDGLNDYLNPHN